MAYIKVEVFVPEEDKWQLIRALNEKEILRDNGYDSVFSETMVIGHFIPLEGSHPDKGEVGKLADVREVKLEFRIKAEDKDLVFGIIKENHPYEVAVINFIELL
ncbi:hypothetical protein [uncultured Anaerococcus sp.]|uniref:hypothetical protein n=1 Tax=uncultured Anaerococcus sp. TaxID=293428 RepID=UPI002608C419|nr:hypothetical protein [uncultured Anaerococcus sp.]